MPGLCRAIAAALRTATLVLPASPSVAEPRSPEAQKTPGGNVWHWRMAMEGLLRSRMSVADGALSPAIARAAAVVVTVVLASYLRPASALTAAVPPVMQLLGTGLPIAVAPGGQSGASVAYNATDDEYLVVWVDSKVSQTSRIYGQRLAPDGSHIGSEIPISPEGGSHGWANVVWSATNDSYVVVWSAQVSALADSICAQSISFDGMLQGSPHLITSGAGRQYPAALVWNPGDAEHFMTLFDVAGGSVQGCRLAFDGTLIGSCFVVSIGGTAVGAGGVASNSVDHEYLVTWVRLWAPNDADVYGQRVRHSGSLVGGSFSIVGSTQWQGGSQAAFNTANSEYLVAWHDGTDGNIYAKRLTRTGSATTGPLTVTTVGTVESLGGLLWDSAGQVYLATANRGAHVYGQVLDSAGNRENDLFLISPGVSPEVGGAAVLDTTRSHYLVVWSDKRNGVDWDVYGQRLWRPLQVLYLPFTTTGHGGTLQ